jgi:hypothetical protein
VLVVRTPQPPKKILTVYSYFTFHQGNYPFSQGLTRGLTRMGYSWETQHAFVFPMDVLHVMNSPEQRAAMANKVLDLIATMQPDLVVVADDLAVDLVQSH